MKKTHASQKGSALIVAILVLVVALAGALGWVAWQNMAPKHKTETSQAKAPIKNSDSANKFLVVKEWGVKLPLTKDIEGISYDYKSSGNVSSITFKSPLVKPCESGLGLISRGKEGIVHYTAPDGTDVAFKAGDHKVGDYYYVFTSPQAPCSDASDTGGIQAETDMVKALEAATQRISAA